MSVGELKVSNPTASHTENNNRNTLVDSSHRKEIKTLSLRRLEGLEGIGVLERLEFPGGLEWLEGLGGLERVGFLGGLGGLEGF